MHSLAYMKLHGPNLRERIHVFVWGKQHAQYRSRQGYMTTMTLGHMLELPGPFYSSF